MQELTLVPAVRKRERDSALCTNYFLITSRERSLSAGKRQTQCEQ